MNTNTKELTMEELGMVSGGDFRDRFDGACFGFTMGSLAGMAAGGAIGVAVGGPIGAATGAEIGIIGGTIGGAIAGAIIGADSMIKAGEKLTRKLNNFFGI